METMQSSLISSPIQELQSRLKGSAFVPSDAGYQQASQPWNLTYSQHPTVVVMARNTRDVVEAIRFAGNGDLIDAAAIRVRSKMAKSCSNGGGTGKPQSLMTSKRCRFRWRIRSAMTRLTPRPIKVAPYGYVNSMTNL
jgi:hypothetical protein